MQIPHRPFARTNDGVWHFLHFVLRFTVRLLRVGGGHYSLPGFLSTPGGV